MTISLGGLAAAIFVLSSASANANAQQITPTASTIRSHFFHQANKSGIIVTPSINYNSVRGQLNNLSGDIKDVGPTYSMQAEYGFTKKFATELKLGYKKGLQTLPGIEIDNEGLTDLLLTLKARHATAPGKSLQYGAFIKHSVDQTKNIKGHFSLTAPDNFAPYESDPHSAGSSLTPFIGYQSIIGGGVGGIQFMQTIIGSARRTKVTAYDAPGPKSVVVKTMDETGGGVTDFRVFYEHPIDQLNLGVSFKYRHHTKVERKDLNSTETGRVTDRLNIVGLIITPTLKLSKNAELVSSIGLLQLMENNITYQGKAVQQGELVDMSVGGRFSF